MAPKKARRPTRTRNQKDPTVRVIDGSYDQEDPVIQMKAIKEALDAYFGSEQQSSFGRNDDTAPPQIA